MAEGVLRHLTSRDGKPTSLEIASVGTHDYHVGRPAFPTAMDVAGRRGYDISQHVARRIAPGDFERFDIILAMDRYNLGNLRKIAPTQAKGKIELLLSYGELYYGEEVPDPFGGEVPDFERALDMIEDGCRGVMQLLLR
jgi:protein-tyrosine phosphatase